MVTQLATRRQPLLSAAQLCHMAINRTSVNTLGMSWTNPSAADRASVRAQAEGVRAYHVDANQWAVPSASRPGQAYRVMVWGAKIACSCECGRAGGSCKHAAAVRIELAKQLVAKPAIAPAPVIAPVKPAATPIHSLADLYD